MLGLWSSWQSRMDNQALPRTAASDATYPVWSVSGWFSNTSSGRARSSKTKKFGSEILRRHPLDPHVGQGTLTFDFK